MLNKKQLNLELGFSLSLKNLVGAYQEISAIRMRRVKKSVLDAREYLSDLGELYNESLSFYRNYVRNKKKNKDKALDKSLFILISSNTGLYGPVMRSTFELFYHDISSISGKRVDIIILGKLGKRWFDDTRSNKPYKFFDISDSGRNDIVLQRLVQTILDYTNVIVYHSFFESVSTQKPKRTVLSGSAASFVNPTTEKNKSIEYCIYEPSIEQVIQFFEDQLLSILFEQSLYESDLGKYASRMISLEKSYLKIDEYVTDLRLLTRKMKSKEFNSTQQNLLSTVLSWK